MKLSKEFSSATPKSAAPILIWVSAYAAGVALRLICVLAPLLLLASVNAQTGLPLKFRSLDNPLTDPESYFIDSDTRIPLGSKTPLLLIPGFDARSEDPVYSADKWLHFSGWFYTHPSLSKQFKLYRFVYRSNQVPVEILGDYLAQLLNSNDDFTTDQGLASRDIVILSYSMGGLVARRLLLENREAVNMTWGQTVLRLITLGTPHHGTPAANQCVDNFSHYTGALAAKLQERNKADGITALLNIINRTFMGSLPYNQPNRSDMLWDNYDGLFTSGFEDDELPHLTSLYQLNSIAESQFYDKNIVAYAGLLDLSSDDGGYDRWLAVLAGILSDGLGLFSDGIVPIDSAWFHGRLDNSQRRIMLGYDHYQIIESKTAPGDFPSLSDPLFTTIASDLTNAIVQWNSPIISAVEPRTLQVSSQLQQIVIKGIGFDQNATLIFNGQTRSDWARIHNSGPTQIEYDLAALSSGKWTVQVVNGETKSPPFTFYVVPETNQKQLIGLSVSGPATVLENSTTGTPFLAAAHYSDGSSSNVTPVWSVSSGAASISSGGQITAGPADGNTEVTISAVFTGGAITKSASKIVTVVHRGENASFKTENLVRNGKFEQGTEDWLATGAFQADSRFQTYHSSPGYAYLANANGSAGNNLDGTLSQSFTIPSNALEATLTFYSRTTSQEGRSNADMLTVNLHFANDSFITLTQIPNGNDGTYIKHQFDLKAHRGKAVTLKFWGKTDISGTTTFRIDDVSLAVNIPVPPIPVLLGIKGPSSVPEGSSADYDVVAVYSDGSVKSIDPTWTVSGPGTVSDGRLTAQTVTSNSTAIISVEHREENVTLRLSYRVDILNLSERSFSFLAIDGPSTLDENSSVRFIASAIFSDGSQQTLSDVDWSVDSPGTITGSGDLSAGEIADDTVVTVAATARLDGMTKTSDHSVLIVNKTPPPVLSGLSILGPSILAANASARYLAIATFSDGTSQTVTPGWAVDGNAGTISESGVLAAGDVASQGNLTISASYSFGGLTHRASVIVTVQNQTPLPPPPHLTDAHIVNSEFNFTLRGVEGKSYAILRSADLKEWVAHLTNELSANGSLILRDIDFQQHQSQFFKAVPIINRVPVAIATNLHTPGRIALSGDFVYFADNQTDNGMLKRVPKSGGPVVTLLSGLVTSDGTLTDFIVTEDKIYGGYGGVGEMKIFSSSTNGDSQSQLFSITAGKFLGAGNGNIYFADGYEFIKSRPISGGDATQLAVTNFVRSSVADDTAIYFVEYHSKDVRKVDLKSGYISFLITGNASEGSVFVDEQNVYGSASGRIAAVSKSGGAVRTLVSSEGAVGYVSDGTNVFYIEKNKIKSVPVAGGAPSTVADLQSTNVVDLTVDADFLYWADVGGGFGAGSIWRISKH